jgi:FkbM family methyltransferase
MATSRIEVHIKSSVRSCLRQVLARRWSRKLVNWLANRSGWYFKQRFHGAFGYVLKDYAGEWKDDVWEVKFLDSKIQIPLRADNLTTDWIVATTLLGHDVSEKQSYRNLLLSPIRPEVFVDVGGNYGTHSLLMLSQAVDVIYFEPNSLCHAYFLSACSFNNFWPRVEHVALGDVAGTKELRYPESATWLGSMHPDTQAALQGSYQCVSECVQQSRLDSFSKDIPDKRLLVKIDAEGYELNILRGGTVDICEAQTCSLLRELTRQQ